MIKVDEQGMKLIKQLEDAVLKGFGLAAVELVNSVEKDVSYIEQTESKDKVENGK